MAMRDAPAEPASAPDRRLAWLAKTGAESPATKARLTSNKQRIPPGKIALLDCAAFARGPTLGGHCQTRPCRHEWQTWKRLPLASRRLSDGRYRISAHLTFRPRRPGRHETSVWWVVLRDAGFEKPPIAGAKA